MRVFAALPFPDAAREQLRLYTASVAPAFNRARPAWVAARNLHLTLHFFGELDQRGVAALRALLVDPATRCAPLCIRTGALSLLPSPRAPRVLYLAADIQPPEPLRHLVRSIREIAKELGAETDVRPWRAHLTLARLKEPWAPELSALPPPPVIDFALDAFDLMSSALRPGGPEYVRIERFALGARAI